jgi:hypothetical protein
MLKIYKDADPEWVNPPCYALVFDTVIIQFTKDGSILCIKGIPQDIFNRITNAFDEMP